MPCIRRLQASVVASGDSDGKAAFRQPDRGTAAFAQRTQVSIILSDRLRVVLVLVTDWAVTVRKYYWRSFEKLQPAIHWLNWNNERIWTTFHDPLVHELKKIKNKAAWLAIQIDQSRVNYRERQDKITLLSGLRPITTGVKIAGGERQTDRQTESVFNNKERV